MNTQVESPQHPADMVDDWRKTVEALPEDKQADLKKMGEEAEHKSPEQVQSEFDSFMASLPPAMQSNLRNIIDLNNLTPEQLRGLVMGGAIDGGLEQLAFSLRGDTKSAPNDWKALSRPDAPAEEVSREQLGRLTPSHTGDATEHEKERSR